MSDMFAMVEKMAAGHRQHQSEVDAQINRDNYAAYVQSMREAGWTAEDVAEYFVEVERIMKSGTDDERAAAREFWQIKMADSRANGSNERIRQSIAEGKRKAA